SDDICDIQLNCPMCGNWNKVNTAIHKALTEVSLADLGTSSCVTSSVPLRAVQQAATSVG
ncbi:MAG: hypothetical protein RIB59_11960, partial [Rhodospirillales bacterium]